MRNLFSSDDAFIDACIKLIEIQSIFVGQATLNLIYLGLIRLNLNK